MILSLLTILSFLYITKWLIYTVLQTKIIKTTIKKWSYIPDRPYRILIIGGSVSGKTNELLDLINEQNDIDKNLLYAKDLSEQIMNFWLKIVKMQE